MFFISLLYNLALFQNYRQAIILTMINKINIIFIIQFIILYLLKKMFI